MDNQEAKRQRLNDNVVPSIAMNTFKGGVSKTTTTYNLAWCLSEKYGVKVLVVDMDPQRNLTQIFLECDEISEETRETVFRDGCPANQPMVNIGEVLTAFLANPSAGNVAVVQTIEHPLCKNLHLLPGSLAVTDYEEELASSELSQSTATRYVAGVLNKIVQATAQAVGAQLVILDTSPSMGCLNMLVVMTSTYFLVPCQTDFFSLKAVELLRKRMFENEVGDKGTWLARAKNLQSKTSRTDFPLRDTLPKFLGVVLQMFTVRKGKVVHAHRLWAGRVRSEINNNLVPALSLHGMCFSIEENVAAGLRDPYVVSEIRNFNRFAPMAQEQGLPIIALIKKPECDQRIGQTDESGKRKALTGTALKAAKQDLKKLTKPIRSAVKVILHFVLPGESHIHVNTLMMSYLYILF